MKRLFILIITSALFVSFNNPPKGSCCSKEIAGRCTGSSPCRACSNCSSCKWCSNGGTCGVCVSKKKKSFSSSPSSTPKSEYVGQCQAITKKGTRCSRKSRSNGYCWQHGG